MEGVNGSAQVRATSFTMIPPNVLAKCEDSNWGAQDLEATNCKPRKPGQVGVSGVQLRPLRPGLGVHTGQDCVGSQRCARAPAPDAGKVTAVLRMVGFGGAGYLSIYFYRLRSFGEVCLVRGCFPATNTTEWALLKVYIISNCHSNLTR